MREAGEGCAHLSAEPACGPGMRITEVVPSLGAEPFLPLFHMDAQSHMAVGTEPQVSLPSPLAVPIQSLPSLPLICLLVSIPTPIRPKPASSLLRQQLSSQPCPCTHQNLSPSTGIKLLIPGLGIDSVAEYLPGVRGRGEALNSTPSTTVKQTPSPTFLTVPQDLRMVPWPIHSSPTDLSAPLGSRPSAFTLDAPLLSPAFPRAWSIGSQLKFPLLRQTNPAIPSCLAPCPG